MNWDLIIGQAHLKNQLKQNVIDNRISHAQLFIGQAGYGVLPLVLAYAKEILQSEKASAGSKVDHLAHLDLHFCFPVFTEDKKSLTEKWLPQFRQMILENPYADFITWKNILESQNKQLFISAMEIDQQNKVFSLKSFEGGSKILIVWQADKMNTDAANKFLKFLEEPPKNTYIFLIAETADDFLPTIFSRCQLVEVPRIKDSDLEKALETKNLSPEEIRNITFAAEGNWNSVERALTKNEGLSDFQNSFIGWVRMAFLAKKQPSNLRDLVIWGREVASWNKEKQKDFLDYCAGMFRSALMQNYANQLVYKRITENFKWENFSKFIHGNNIEAILDEISTANLHLVRNANPKIVWTDLAIKLTRYLHRSAS